MADAAGRKPELTEEEIKRQREEKKKAKEAEKAAKEAKKAAAADSAAKEAADAIAKISLTSNFEEAFGDYDLIASQTQTKRNFVDVDSLVPTETPVWIRARLHNVRGKGKLAFIVLRQKTATVQAVVAVNDFVSKEFVKYAMGLPKETIVDVQGTVTAASEKIASCSKQEVEVQVRKLYAVSKSQPVLPFQLEDASRPEDMPDADPNNPFVRVNQDTRLDNRVIDLRTTAKQAIFRIQSAVGTFFREFLLSQDFVEIHTPKIIPGASEGGAAVFKVKYFDRECCLAQSPQLYKQMAITADLDRVFEVGSVFRAENSNTHRHLTEFIGLDLEMAIKEHYYEVLDVLDGLFVYIFENLEKRCAKELAAVRAQFPFTPFKYRKPSLRITFAEGIKMLRDAGVEVGDYDDLNTAQEKKLGALVREKYDTDFYMMDQYPLAVRPFYTMPNPNDKRYSNSYDLFMRGEEIVSGAQRVHDPALLEQRATEMGISVPSLQGYIDAFKYGAPPHGGAGVGLERVTMLYLGLPNIRNTSMFPRDPQRLFP
eukprot:tig00000865_g5082.t1